MRVIEADHLEPAPARVAPGVDVFLGIQAIAVWITRDIPDRYRLDDSAAGTDQQTATFAGPAANFGWVAAGLLGRVCVCTRIANALIAARAAIARKTFITSTP